MYRRQHPTQDAFVVAPSEFRAFTHRSLVEVAYRLLHAAAILAATLFAPRSTARPQL